MSDFNLFNGSSDPLLTTIDTAPKGKIHIRFQKTGPRSITLIEGLEADLDLKRIAKSMKKGFSCASSIHVDEKTQESYIKLQGDHRDNVRDWLLKEEIVMANEAKERIVVHGY
jgi:translation initiation factor SUI1